MVDSAPVAGRDQRQPLSFEATQKVVDVSKPVE
jgi:hypothetical protein